MLVAVVCCTVFIFQNVAGIPFPNEGDEERTIDSIEPSDYLSINGTIDIAGTSFDVALWYSIPLMTLRIDLNPSTYKSLLKLKFYYPLNNSGTLRLYATWLGDQFCYIVPTELTTEQTTIASETSNKPHFEGVEEINGEEVEKWVSDNYEIYVKRNEEVVPVRVVLGMNEKPAMSIDVKEYSIGPISDSVFDYDSSFSCTEVQGSPIHDYTEVSSRLRAFVKRSA